MGNDRELAPGEWSVLALLREQPAHGWALATTLSPEGQIGSVWSLGRPLVYRSLEILEKRGLIEPAGLEPSARGPQRTVFRITERGREQIDAWFRTPVTHVHEIRAGLLLKLVFAGRGQLDIRPMLDQQLEILDERVEQLEARLADSEGAERIMSHFRLETALAARRFVEGQHPGYR